MLKLSGNHLMDYRLLLRPLKIAIGVYLTYLILVMLVAMPLMNVIAQKIHKAQTGLELHLGSMTLLNPITLTVTVGSASCTNADGSRIWAFDRLFVNVSLSSLWRGALVLDEVRLSGLDVQIEQLSAERYNFSGILDHRASQSNQQQAEPEKLQTEGGELFPLFIERLILNASRLSLKAPYVHEPITIQANNLDLKVREVSTEMPEHETPKADGLPSVRSGTIDFSIGSLKAQLQRSGKSVSTEVNDVLMKLDHFSTTNQEHAYNLKLKSGKGGNLTGVGTFSLAAQRSHGVIRLNDFNLLPVAEYLSEQLPFDVHQALLDIEAPFQVRWNEGPSFLLDNGHAALRGVKLQSRQDANTNMGFAALRLDGVAVNSSALHLGIAKVTLEAPTVSGWNDDTRVSLLDMLQFPKSDDSKPTPWHVRIDDISANNGNIRWRASQLDTPELAVSPIEFHASNLRLPEAPPLQLNANATINGTTTLAVAGEISPTSKNGKLSADIGNLPLEWGNSLLGKQVSAMFKSGQFGGHFELALENGEPTTLQSDGTVSELKLEKLADRKKIVAWQALEWKQLAVDLRSREMRLEKITLGKPWVQFRINADGTNNLQQLLVPQPKSETSESKEGKPWQLAINTIQSDNGTLDFQDDSLSLPFHTLINNFNGSIVGISNQSKKAAKVSFKGNVDSFTPVALTGTANPFSQKPELNIALDITNLDLAALTPYSGTYAGYTINSGRLTVQLAYALENNRIKGHNHIVVNKLELGKQVTGPKVMDLPLRLAIYLLTDSNGVMDLGVDVTGDVNDPEFDISKIIWKAFGNAIMKAVSAPFQTLGSILGIGADLDLGVINFDPASDLITDESQSKLSALKQILGKKPLLHLRIVGHGNSWQDVEAFKEGILNEQLIKAGLNEVDIRQQSRSWQRKIEELFHSRFPDDKNKNLIAVGMKNALRNDIPLEANTLADLAGRRALAVKRVLVTDMGVPADRVSIDTPSGDDNAATAPQVTLKVE